MRVLRMVADLSPAMARIARAKEPIPAERIAAAPEPFVWMGTTGGATEVDGFIFLLRG
jgi:hypothetical protein